ncbi:hypothetical protein HK105_202510 [Polyrhizophydium stewartii]|uniref:Protein YIP n=1 Tax=Polyrhizophydium stewartii TaxID=2732419 RepID=A0ABR4NEZ7_9FUNG
MNSSGAGAAAGSSYDHLLDIEPVHDAQAELEFQNFVLSSAEADLLAGKSVKSPAPPARKPTLPPARGSVLAVAGGMAGAVSHAMLACPDHPADEFGFSAPTPGAALPGQQQPQQTQQGQQQQAPGGSSAFWTFEYWTQYFQIDTNDVANRILASVLPTKSFPELLGNNPDFYGPFWIPTTVIFTLFATSTMAESIARAWSGQKYEYDVTQLSYAGATVYTYVVLLPAIIWGIAKYFHVASIKLFDMINVYGYGMFIWIPVSLLCIIQSDLFRWILVLAAFALSAFFHVRSIHPLAAQSSNSQATSLIFIVVLIAQASLALLFKIQFFQHTIQIGSSTEASPTPSASTPTAT